MSVKKKEGRRKMQGMPSSKKNGQQLTRPPLLPPTAQSFPASTVAFAGCSKSKDRRMIDLTRSFGFSPAWLIISETPDFPGFGFLGRKAWRSLYYTVITCNPRIGIRGSDSVM